MMGTYADALAAVDATFRNDTRLPFPDAYCLCGASFYAIGAAHTFAAI